MTNQHGRFRYGDPKKKENQCLTTAEELTKAIANYQPKKISIKYPLVIIFVESETIKSRNKYISTKHIVQCKLENLKPTLIFKKFFDDMKPQCLCKNHQSKRQKARKFII